MRDDVTDSCLIEIGGADIRELLAQDRGSGLARVLVQVIAPDNDVYSSFQNSIV
jgi:hypothetical protein